MIKISSFASVLHESNLFDNENTAFICDIEKELEEKIIVSPLDDYDCSLKLILIASGGSENYFLQNINKLKEPYYLLTTGKNNSLAASMEILTYLNNNNKCGEIIHGDIKYIANRIRMLNKKNNKEVIRLGVIGKPSDWLISSIPNYERIKEIFNIELVDISLNEAIDEYFKVKDYDEALKGFNLEELNKSNNFYKAIKKVINKYQIKGLTIRCFDLLDKINTTGCLSLAKLNKEGIIGSCEGDVMALVCMYLIRKWFNKSSFQANPSRIDVDNKIINFAHCTCPLDMLVNYKYDTHFESGIGVAIKGKFEEKDVTVFRISSDLKNYYVGEGKIVNNLDDKRQCRSQIEIKMNDDIEVLLKRPCGNHHIIFYGHHKDEIIKKLEEIMR